MGKFNVLEHAANKGGLPVRNTVHIQFVGVFKELIEQDGLARSDVEDLADNGFHFLLIIDDKHAAPAEDKGWAKEDGKADFIGQLVGLLL